MTTCVLLFAGGFSPGAPSAQETSPDTSLSDDESHDDSDSARTTPPPPPPPRPIEVGLWRISSAEMTGTGRVEARGRSASGLWVVSSDSWQTRGEQLLFTGDARLVGEDWVLQAPRVVLEPSERGWFALATRDVASGDSQEASKEASKAALVLLFKEGIPIEARSARVELDSGKISLEGIGRVERRDDLERKRESVREE